MKKFAFLMACGLFLFAGCGAGNKVVCSGTEEIEGMKVEAKVTATLKDEKVDEVGLEMIFSDEDSAKQYCAMFEFVNAFAENEEDKVDYECNGKKVILKDASTMFDEDDEKIVGKTKEEFIKYMEAEDLTCK